MGGLRVYIDESGDEGFSFKPGGGGSSEWFVLAGVVTRTETDLQTVKVIDRIRDKLYAHHTDDRKRRAPLHFRDLSHEQRVVACDLLAKEPVRTLVVMLHKPSLVGSGQRAPMFVYTFCTLLLLSQLATLRQVAPVPGDAAPELIFSNRGNMSNAGLRLIIEHALASDELRLLTKKFQLDTSWRSFSAVNSGDRLGLQAADILASAYWYGINANRFGHTEPRYAQILGLLAPHVAKHSFGVCFAAGEEVQTATWLSCYRVRP